MKNHIYCFVLLFCFLSTSAQSVMQEQKIYYDRFKLTKEKDWDTLQERLLQRKFQVLPQNAQLRNSACRLVNKRVYGWHPYWNGSSTHNNYQWNLLSDLCYFDYSINSSNGSNSNTSFAWNTSTAVTAAKNNGVRVSFCATLFSGHATFLASATAQNAFISNTITLLKMRGGSGVCIDFEGMPSTQKSNFVSFMQNLSRKIHDSIPGGEVALALYAVDWSGVFDIPNLKNAVDLFIIMGYDYYYGGSSNAGPTDPLYPFVTSYNYGLSKSISYYLNLGIPNNKLLLAVPYYGRQYQTSGSAIPSVNSGGASASSVLSYRIVKANTSGNYRETNKRWDANSFSPYYVFQSSSLWYQCFINDSFSMRRRYDIVNQRGLAGIGIWALGYDDGYADLWNAIGDNFSSCYAQPVSDSLFDMGGPNRNYNDRESYEYTIAPPDVNAVSVSFSQFDLEANYDSLFLYDGSTSSAPLLGRYSGVNSPGILSSSGPSLTLRFKSDGATNKSGYKLHYKGYKKDTIPPTTRLLNQGWVTGSFSATFADNDMGSGVKNRFYSIEELSSVTDWRGKNSKGCFNDAFDGTAIHSDWTKPVGSWTVNSNALYQSDQLNTNTNIYAPLTQNSNQILYHWNQKVSGSGTNRRAGLHFMCSHPTGNGRGNSYLVMARIDGGGKLQIYKSSNDMVFLNVDTIYPFVANVNYDFKVIYNKPSGELTVFVNNQKVVKWIDTLPLTLGNYISFRTGESTISVDQIEVLKSRTSNSVYVTVGESVLNDINRQNTDASTSVVRIKSYVVDSSGLFSLASIQGLNVDYTYPSAVPVVRDGLTLTDIATTTQTAQLAANWDASTDQHSGIRRYWYAIGTSPGGTDVLDWTDNSNTTYASRTALILYVGTTYFCSVKAENNAGLIGPVISSNGQKLVSSFPYETALLKSADTSVVRISFSNLKDYSIFPNPASSSVNISYTLGQSAPVNIYLYNSFGKLVTKILENNFQQAGVYDYKYKLGEDLPKGIYILLLSAGSDKCVFKVCFD